MNPTPAAPLNVTLHTDIQARPQHVWDTMLKPEVLRAWASITVFTPELGAPLHQYTDAVGEPAEPEAAVHHITGQVVTLDPPETLAFTWQQVRGPGGAWPAPTLVTLRLDPTAQGTRVTVTHSGFEALEHLGADLRDGHEAGWTEALRLLKAHAEGD